MSFILIKRRRNYYSLNIITRSRHLNIVAILIVYAVRRIYVRWIYKIPDITTLVDVIHVRCSA